MIKEEKATKEVIIRRKYCDDCIITIPPDILACSVTKCEICGKDLCHNCIAHEDFNTGDYRIVYCSRCWNIGEPYRKKINKLENEIERLEDEWQEKCKNDA